MAGMEGTSLKSSRIERMDERVRTNQDNQDKLSRQEKKCNHIHSSQNEKSRKEMEPYRRRPEKKKNAKVRKIKMTYLQCTMMPGKGGNKTHKRQRQCVEHLVVTSRVESPAFVPFCPRRRDSK